jgi:hypothetical protein
MRYLLAIIAFVSLMLSSDAFAQGCRAKKPLSACMKCVQQSGHAGRSGGRDYCLGLVSGRDTEEYRPRRGKR